MILKIIAFPLSRSPSKFQTTNRLQRPPWESFYDLDARVKKRNAGCRTKFHTWPLPFSFDWKFPILSVSDCELTIEWINDTRTRLFGITQLRSLENETHSAVRRMKFEPGQDLINMKCYWNHACTRHELSDHCDNLSMRKSSLHFWHLCKHDALTTMRVHQILYFIRIRIIIWIFPIFSWISLFTIIYVFIWKNLSAGCCLWFG